MEEQKTKTSWGWWWPPFNSRKAHYFKPDGKGRSLCQRYLSFIPDTIAREAEDFDDDLKTNCATCKKLVAALRKRQAK